MRTRRVLLFLVALLLLSSPLSALAGTSGEDEADVVDITSDTGVQAPTDAQPGQNSVVVQAVLVADPGDKGDKSGDNFDTAIDTVVVTKVEGSTLEDRFVRKIRLYLDEGSKKFEPDKDFLLSEQSNPDLTGGVTFGAPGTLLTLIEGKRGTAAGSPAILFVVMDFANDAPDGTTLRTSLDMTVGDSLVGGPTISSDFDLAAFPPVLRGAGKPAYFFLRITSTTGNDETDIIDETPAITATLGDLAVLQQFTIADPGPAGDATGDGNPTLVRNITVKKLSGTAGISGILKLMLYRETATTPPGFQEEDELLSVVNNPNLDAGVVFHNSGRRLLRVADNSEERLYIAAQLAAVGFEDGDTLQTEITVVAKNDPGITDLTGEGVSSGIETPMPVAASSSLLIEVPPPTIFLGTCRPPEAGVPCNKPNPRVELKPNGQVTIYLAVRYVPEPGLGELQLGPEGAIVYDPEILKVTKVRGLDPYQVEAYNLATSGMLRFVASLKPGREGINEGPVVAVTVEAVEGVEPGTETELLIADDSGLQVVDVFKDADGKDLVPDVVECAVKIKLIQGDVDGDSAVTATDARIVARSILGLETLTAEQREAADVASPFGVIDVTDVRYIAQAAAGLRQLDPAAISASAVHSKPGLLAALGRLFGFHAPVQTEITASMIADALVIRTSGARPIDVQGTLSFDPTSMQVERITGANGYTVLASQIDNDAGRVRFVASLIDGLASGGAILQLEVRGRTESLRLAFDLLRDGEGRDLLASIAYDFSAAPLTLSGILAERTVWGHILFEAQGTAISTMRVQVFNLAGVRVFDSGSVAGSTLEWNLLDNQGRVLANGVYLYAVTVKGLDERTISSAVKKLVLLK